VDPQGNLYIDSGLAVIREVLVSNGTIQTVAGQLGATAPGDGGPATAALLLASDIAVDTSSNLYIAGANRIRVVNAQTGIISTIAGDGVPRSTGDGLPPAQAEMEPGVLALDKSGNIFFTDAGRNIRELNAKTGIVSRIAGMDFDGYSGDGGSPLAATMCPADGMALDATGNNLTFVDTCFVGARQITLVAPAPAPSFNPPAGAYSGPQAITIADTAPNAVIHYTTDGSVPTTQSSIYSSPITVAANETLNALATAAGYAQSPTGIAAYTITLPTPTVSIGSSAASAFLSNPVTFTANIAGSPGTPTGTATFFDGTTQLGTGTLSAGSATYSTSSLAAGSHSITVSYPGDSNFKSTTSTALTETIVDFTFATPAGSSASASVSAGPAATYTLAVTPSNGAATPEAITLAVAGAPTGSAITFSPASVAAGSGATSITLSIGVPASAARKAVAGNTGLAPSGTIPPAVAILFLPLLGLRRIRRALGGRAMILLLTLTGAGAIFGCGGGGSKSTPPPQSQNYTLTVTAASGSLSHSTTLTLTVQ
jgi:hypothetical protein